VIPALPDLVHKPDLRILSQTLADDVAEVLRRAVEQRGRAVLAVPGGETPRQFLELLGQQELPWGKIKVVPTDERRVSPDHPRSNERMIRERLPLSSENFIPLRIPDDAPEEALGSLSQHVAVLGAIDAAVIGMGTDAHVASLFPGDQRLSPANRQAASDVIAADPDGLEPRLSLGPSPLMAARWKALLITGEEKLSMLMHALQSEDPVSYPVRIAFEGEFFPRVYFAE
jgi:6-phosphogluconolactonase